MKKGLLLRFMIIRIRNLSTIRTTTLQPFVRVWSIGLLYLILLSYTTPVRAQSADLNTFTKKDRVDTLISLANALAREDIESALKYTKEGLELSQSLDYYNGEAAAFLALGRIQIIQGKYDSAHLVLKSADTLVEEHTIPSLKAELLNTYGWLAQREKEFDKSIDFHREAYDALTERGTEIEASIHTNLGITWYFKSEFDSAKKYYEKGLLIRTQRKDSSGMLNGYRNIGIILRRKGHTRESIQLFFDALRIAEALGLQSSIADVNNSIGVAFDHLKEYENALKHYQTTLGIRRQLPDKRRLANVLSNIGWIYSELGQYTKALESCLESLEINQKIGADNANEAVYSNIGLIYKGMEKYDSAYLYYEKSLEAYKSTENKGGMALVFTNMASVHFNKKEYRKAVKLLEDNLPLIETHGNSRTVMIAYEHLYEYNEVQGLIKEAFKYHKLYKQMTDSIFSIDKAAEVFELSEKYESEKKERELAHKDSQIDTLERLANLRMQLIIISFIGGLIVFTLITFLIWFRNQRKKRMLLAENELMQTRFAKEQLEKEQVGLLLKSKEKELLSFALNLTQKNDLLRRMKEVIERKIKNKGTLKADFKELETLIDSNDQSEKEWESFKHLFQELHHDFFNKLKVKHADLTIYETRLCALIKLNLSSAEMSGMLNISISSLTSARYRLRKKLSLEGKDDLNLYIEAFNGIVA